MKKEGNRQVWRRILSILGLTALTALCMWPKAAAVVTTSPTNPEPLRENHTRWVKIGLTLTPYVKNPKRKTGGGKEAAGAKAKRGKTERYTLRAKLNKSNHFYLGDYHVQTTPLFLEKRSGRYGVKVRIYGKFGAMGQVEEEIGSLDVDGLLQGKGPIYVLKGAARRKFHDKLGKPLLLMTAGLGTPKDSLKDKNGEKYRQKNISRQLEKPKKHSFLHRGDLEHVLKGQKKTR